MNRAMGVGVALTVAGLGGYVVGVTVPYPGRSFSVTAFMVGLTLLAVGQSLGAEGVGS